MEHNLDPDLRLNALVERLPELLGTSSPGVDAILARTPTLDAEVQLRSRRFRRWWTWPLAAAALLVIGALVTFLQVRSDGGSGFGAESFVTGATEAATITLSDGSVVKLAPRTRLQLEPSRSERLVRLDGQGFFAVAHRRRPFVIRTFSGDVRVLGTRFDLSARDDDLQLIVVEGRVQVSSHGGEADVRAGQVNRIVNGTQLPVQNVRAPQTLTAWVGRFIAFQATPLGDAAREIMFHYDVRIDVDPALRERTITAWFSDWSLDDVMTVFCTVVEARCDRKDGVIKVVPAQQRAVSR